MEINKTSSAGKKAWAQPELYILDRAYIEKNTHTAKEHTLVSGHFATGAKAYTSLKYGGQYLTSGNPKSHFHTGS